MSTDKLKLGRAHMYLELESNGILQLRIHNTSSKAFEQFNAFAEVRKIDENLEIIDMLVHVRVFHSRKE